MSLGLSGWLSLESALADVAGVSHATVLDRFRADLDPAWIDQALAATGTATLRKRRLPAEQVIWLVLGMALYRDRPIHELVDRLDLVLPGGKSSIMAPSAVVEARARLGADPMEWLFEKSARKWAHESARRHA